MKQKSTLLATVTLVVAACSESPAPTRPSFSTVDNTSYASYEAQAIPGRFIVTLRPDASPAAVARTHGVSPNFVYTHALNGFAGSISDAARNGLIRDARVERVEADGIASINVTQSGATWGLDRIDQRSLPLSGTYAYTNTAAGVTAYIIDTGIETSHSEFGGRASIGVDVIGDGRNGIDCNGHGTHVSGTVGGSTYGVAKGVTLVGVRVLDCAGSGSWSGVIAGIDWVVGNHGTGPAVSNLSLGGGASASVDDAVKRMIADGVASAVAAGNGNQGGRQADACKYSPARVPEAMTIGATDSNDTKTSWSNYGNCVDWFAPGLGIKSAWLNNGTNTISGTSMATPHTAGVAALYLQTNPGATPQQVRDALFANTTKGIVKSSSTTNNHLLFTNY